jgi:hypothetical protein
MKILLTENQTSNVLQMLINRVLEDFKNVCDEDYEGEEPDWFHGDECVFMDYVTKVKVIESSVEPDYNGSKMIIGKVDIYHTDDYEFDEEDFLYYITDTLRIKYKVRVSLKLNEQIF